MLFTAGFFLLTGLLLIVLAIPMIRGKVKRNAWYGMRLPVTQKSDDIWYPANAYAGKGLVVSGLIVMVTAVLLPLLLDMSVDAYAIVMTVILLVGLFAVFGFSYRYAKKLDAQLASASDPLESS